MRKGQRTYKTTPEWRLREANDAVGGLQSAVQFATSIAWGSPNRLTKAQIKLALVRAKRLVQTLEDALSGMEGR